MLSFPKFFLPMRKRNFDFLLLHSFYVLLLFFISPKKAQENQKEFSIYYPLQSVFISPESNAQIKSFLQKQSPGSYYLIQSFACRVGGFSASHKTADLRTLYLSDLLQKQGLGIQYLKEAPSAVYEERPHKKHRRTDLRSFQNRRVWQRAYERAESEARKINEKSRERIEEHRKSLGAQRKHETLRELYFTLAFLFLLLLFRYSSPIWDQLKKRKHRLRRKEVQALASLTEALLQEKLGPLFGRKKFLPLRSIKDFLDSNNRFPYMAKKTKASIEKGKGNLVLPGIAKPFANKSLKMLCKAPVHALTGLSPRHGQLLDEAFGIKTVGDLAKLKYVEIAKAIAILSEYES